jgi:hypothetical protein
MRGNFLHNQVLIAPIECEARIQRAIVHREYRVVTSSVDGFVDLLVTTNSKRTVYEAENTLDRVRWDITKALALQADELQIIFPTGRLARAAQERVNEIKDSGKATRLSIYCLTVGAAVKRLKDNKRFDVGLNVVPTSIPQSQPHMPKVASPVERN